ILTGGYGERSLNPFRPGERLSLLTARQVFLARDVGRTGFETRVRLRSGGLYDHDEYDANRSRREDARRLRADCPRGVQRNTWPDPDQASGASSLESGSWNLRRRAGPAGGRSFPAPDVRRRLRTFGLL